MVPKVPIGCDSPPRSVPRVCIREGRFQVPDLPIFLPSLYPRPKPAAQTLRTQKVTAQAASALESRSPVEKVIRDTDRDTREAQSSVEVQRRAQGGFLEEVLLGPAWEQG